MDQHGLAQQPTALVDESSPLIHLDDDVDVAAQLVQRFGYDEAERIMFDAIDDDTSVIDEVRRAQPDHAA